MIDAFDKYNVCAVCVYEDVYIQKYVSIYECKHVSLMCITADEHTRSLSSRLHEANDLPEAYVHVRVYDMTCTLRQHVTRKKVKNKVGKLLQVDSITFQGK